jgi:hypothetical protein
MFVPPSSGSNFSLHSTDAGICVEDQFEETGTNKGLLGLTNDGRFAGDTKNLMILVMLVMHVDFFCIDSDWLPNTT